MTDTPPTPKRRRWRWLVVGLPLLLFFGVLAWWYWPTEDPRFVGRWTFGNTLENARRGGWVIQRWPNGTLRQFDPNGELISTRRWKVSEGQYHDGFPTADPKRFMKAIAFENWLFRQIHISFSPKMSSYTIVSIDEDVIHLKHFDQDDFYVRVPE